MRRGNLSTVRTHVWQVLGQRPSRLALSTAMRSHLAQPQKSSKWDGGTGGKRSICPAPCKAFRYSLWPDRTCHNSGGTLRFVRTQARCSRGLIRKELRRTLSSKILFRLCFKHPGHNPSVDRAARQSFCAIVTRRSRAFTSRRSRPSSDQSPLLPR